MERFTLFTSITVVLVFSLASSVSFALEIPRIVDGHDSIINGGNLEMSKTASRDTVCLIGPWGSGAVVNGQFEDPSGAPDWNGWTSVDLTQRYRPRWHVDTYNVVAGDYSAWCGDISYESCAPEDPVGGYGPSYNEFLSWYGIVGNPDVPTTVNISATVNHNTEPGYDFSNLGYWKDDYDIVHLWTADGEGEQVGVSGSVTFQAGDYVGKEGNQVRVSWQVTSDGGWDDADCYYYGDGALQVDDLSVTMTNDGVVTSTYDDFETSGPLGTLGDNWVVEFPPGVGDYAHLRTGLKDEDPCASNYSPVACFIADEIMFTERGLPVAFCLDWCYGPGGYIVTTDGGQKDWGHIHNAIESPVIPWPTGDYLGVRFLFDVFKHEDLSVNSAGIFYTWGIRSTASGNPADIEQERFQDRNFVYYGGPEWMRGGESEAADLVVPGCTYVQVQLAVYELSLFGGWDGEDGYPAPYFDNVSLKCYEYFGPAMSARELDLAQDTFPADGQIHLGADMHLNDIRFDMANNISPRTHLRNDPGDSIVCSIVAVRTGSTLVETDVDPLVKTPRLYWILQPGPSVDPAWRTNLDLAGSNGSLDANGNLFGEVQGAPAVANGVSSPDRWMFDLPDEDFLYPGDVLHYFMVAWDNVSGDYQYATLPPDRTGFGDFTDPQAYDPRFKMHALPTLKDDQGSQPDILFWNDFGNRGGRDEWHNAFGNLGLVPGEDFDFYYTNQPSSGLGNGLGGRAAYGQLDGYDILLYTSGDLGINTITDVRYDYHYHDAGDDVGLLDNWLEQGGKYLFATGDGLVLDLIGSGPTTQAFISDWMGVTWRGDDTRPLLGGDTAPEVNAIPGNSVFATTESWMAYGSCPVLNTFDALTADGSEMLAVFNDGVSGLSAATKCTASNGSVVLSMPYDFMTIWTPSSADKIDQPAGRPRRVDVLQEVLADAGAATGTPTGITFPDAAFTANAFPNPFNPVTKIEFNMPQAGHLSLKIFNVRGELVRTLIDEVRPQGPGHIMWNGTTDQGRRVSSGVYFYEARTSEGVEINKMTLVQ